jgi:hypothetical protein
MGWWTSVWIQRAQHWTYAPLEPQQVPDHLQHEPIPANQAYVSIFLRSMRVVNVRRGIKKFYGAVHSYISLPHLSQAPNQKAQFHHLTTPSNLKDVDASHIDRVITVNERLLGPVPYRGGDLELEVGLFSVKSVDLAGPFLSVLEGLSSAANVSFVNMARPFVDPLLQGLNLLVGAQGDAILEVGLSRTFDKPKTGYFLIMRAPLGAVPVANLRVQDEDYALFDATGCPLDRHPYMVISIEVSQQREDWFSVPELASAYKELQKDVEEGRVKATKNSQAVFNRIALTSPDLLQEDAKRIVEEVDKFLKEGLSTRTAAGRFSLPDLDEIKIYE